VSHLPLLKLAKALARLKSSPRGRNRSPEFLRPARDLLTAVLPSVSVDSWLFPRHRVRRGTLFPSAQLRRPRSHRSPRLPQLRRPRHRGEERRRLQPFNPPRSDPLRPILIERLGPRVPLRTHVPNALSRLSVSPTVAHPFRSDFPRPILIERLEPLRTPSPSDPD
jgi:hypothetical protein